MSVSRWAYDTGRDTHSLSVDSRTASSVDFHLQTQYPDGRYIAGTGYATNDNQTSMLLDAGNPVSDDVLEPDPNGGRVNIGMYGDSGEASKTATNAHLVVVSLNDGGRFDGTGDLYWHAIGDATGHLVAVDYSPDSGDTWSSIATGLTAALEFVVWTSTTYQSSAAGVWRVTSENDASVSDTNDIVFALRNDPLHFYVNDTYGVGDVYTTASGNDTNSGAFPSLPKASVQNVIDTYDLEPGDIVYVDTGNYLITSTITIENLDSGSESNYVTFLGSTNGAAGGTQITKYGGGDLFKAYQAPWVALRYFHLAGAATGIRFHKANHGFADWIDVSGGTYGLYIDDSDDVIVGHCALRGASEAGAWVQNSFRMGMGHSVLWSNQYGVYLRDSSVNVSNTAVAALAAGDYGYYKYSGTLSSDYNNIHLDNGGFAGAVVGAGGGGGLARYSTLGVWSSGTGQDLHSLSFDPRFIDANSGDFHLKSEQGRYQAGVGWVTNDSVSSFLIDSAVPTSPYTNEPMPNGQWANMGLYGNTWQASKTPTNGWLAILTLNDGGSISGTQSLYWIARGPVTNEMAILEFSDDGGTTWIDLATNVLAGTGSYEWNTMSYQSTPLGLWKITSSANTNITDECDNFFYVRNTNLIFYINDSSTNGDMYTSAIGADINYGIKSGFPKASVQDVLDTYNLEPGDIVYIDTGEYEIDTAITWTDLDAGDTNDFVSLIGSTNEAAGGTYINRQMDDDYVIHLYQTAAVLLKNLRLERGGDGVKLEESPYCRAERVRCQNNASSGFNLYKSGSAVFANCIIWDNNTNGLVCTQSGMTRWLNGVIWDSGNAISLQSGSLQVSNSVLQADGYGKRVYAVGSSASVYGDYNEIIATNGALVAEVYQQIGGNDYYPNLTKWVRDYGQDSRSLSHGHHLVDPYAGNFRPQSVTGHYVPGSGWVADSEQSPLIDTGSPVMLWTNEPDPNGSRINIGAYGNESDASMSVTNPWLLAISFNGGGIAYGSNWIYWAAGNMASTDTVELLYSLNAGLDWNLIAAGVTASNEAYQWSIPAILSVQAKWKVVSEVYSGVEDTIDNTFSIRNEALTYYVNDAVTNGDVYTTTIGDPDNSGLSPDAPLDSIITLFAEKSIIAGDEVYIDTGSFTNAETWTINDAFVGMDGLPVMIYGSTNSEAGGTIVVSETNESSTAYGLNFSGAQYVSLDSFTFFGGDCGMVIGGSEDLDLNNIIVHDVQGNAFQVSSSYDIDFLRCLAYNNGGLGLSVAGQGNTRWLQGVCWSNMSGAVALSGNVSLQTSNSILHAVAGSCLYLLDRYSSPSADFNLFTMEDGAIFGSNIYYNVSYDSLSDWQDAINGDTHTIVQDALFADPAAGDFHLKSSGGRFDGLNWTNDTVSSWAIDGGNYVAAYSNEPMPNGARLNVGLYGNTWQASMSPTNQALLAVSLEDGGTVSGSETLFWRAQGFDSNDLLTLEFSHDGGGSWSNIVTGVAATADGYLWDATGYNSTPMAYWRVYAEEDPLISDTNNTAFFLRVGAIIYYVNDNNTNGDVYCTAVGDDANYGLSESTPKLSLQAVLDAYNFEGGDVVYIDTGHYVDTNGITIGVLDGGVSTARVSIVGSPNIAAGGSVLDTSDIEGSGFVLYVNAANYLDLSNLFFQNANNGIRFKSVSGCIVSNVVIRDCGGAGLSFDSQAGNNIFQRITVTRCAGAGVYMSAQCNNNSFENCVIWSNATDAFHLGSGISVSNSVLSAGGAGSSIYNTSIGTGSKTINADYNTYCVSDGADYGPGLDGAVMEGLPQWVASRTQDIHTLSVDPQFVDISTDDFHLKSQAGHYIPGGVYGYDFGSVGIGTYITNTLVITNSGNSSLILNGMPLVQITGTHTSDFSVVLQPTSPVPTNSSTYFEISFGPITSGVRSAEVLIPNNDEDQDPFNFFIHGEGE